MDCSHTHTLTDIIQQPVATIKKNRKERERKQTFISFSGHHQNRTKLLDKKKYCTGLPHLQGKSSLLQWTELSSPFVQHASLKLEGTLAKESPVLLSSELQCAAIGVQKKDKNKAKPFCSTPGKGHSETTVLGRQPSCLDSTANCALGGIEGTHLHFKMTHKGKFLQTLSFQTA